MWDHGHRWDNFPIFVFPPSFSYDKNACFKYDEKTNVDKTAARFYSVKVATNDAHHFFIHDINLKGSNSFVIGNTGACDLRENVQNFV